MNKVLRPAGHTVEERQPGDQKEQGELATRVWGEAVSPPHNFFRNFPEQMHGLINFYCEKVLVARNWVRGLIDASGG